MGEAVAAEWKREAAEEIDRATPAERERFQAIDPRAQRAFLGGQLNPMILMPEPGLLHDSRCSRAHGASP